MPTLVGNEGNLNGTTWVTAIAAPASGMQRWVDSLKVDNLSDVDIDVEVRKNKGGTITNVGGGKVYQGAKPGQMIDKSVTLDATDESLEVRTAASYTGTAPRFDASAVETP